MTPHKKARNKAFGLLVVVIVIIITEVIRTMIMARILYDRWISHQL